MATKNMNKVVDPKSFVGLLKWALKKFPSDDASIVRIEVKVTSERAEGRTLWDLHREIERRVYEQTLKSNPRGAWFSTAVGTKVVTQ